MKKTYAHLTTVLFITLHNGLTYFVIGIFVMQNITKLTRFMMAADIVFLMLNRETWCLDTKKVVRYIVCEVHGKMSDTKINTCQPNNIFWTCTSG